MNEKLLCTLILFSAGDRVIHFITSLIPILGWLPKYKIKQDLFSDIIAGFTVAMVHLPQGNTPTIYFKHNALMNQL